MQEFKRAARGSGYKGRPLVEEFKRGINGGIRRKLMEAENLLTPNQGSYNNAYVYAEANKTKKSILAYIINKYKCNGLIALAPSE